MLQNCIENIELQLALYQKVLLDTNLKLKEMEFE